MERLRELLVRMLAQTTDPGRLLAGLFFGSLVALYVVLLAQVKRRRLTQLKVTHVSERLTEWEEPQVRVIAN